jgi:3-hydroxybutyryl-CoA dehydrogenase
MREGRNGLRDGKGFYDFSGVDLNQYKKEVLGKMLAMLKHLGLMRPPGMSQGDSL